MADHIHRVPVNGPYDLFGSLRFARFGKTDPSFTLSAHRVERGFWFRGAPTTFTAKLLGDQLEIRVEGDRADEVRELAPQLLGWASPAYAVTGHPLMERLSDRYRGVRRISTPHLGYDLIQTVMQQLIEWREAASAWRRMVQHLGHPAPGHQLLRVPPSYEEIASLSLSTFQKLGISRKRGAVIRELGRIGHRLDSWVDEPEDLLRERLLSIPGIGPWTVDHCFGFSLSSEDVVPLGDYALPHTVCWALAGERRGSDQRMLELLTPWAGRRWSVLRLIFAANLRAPRRGPRIAMGHADRPRF